jgi:hypothetical protein
MTGGFRRFLIISIIFLIIFNACPNFLIWGSGNEKASYGPRALTESRKVVGPKHLINNSDFSSMDDWNLINATESGIPVIAVEYDNITSPSFVRLFNFDPIDNSPFLYRAYINQTFTKDIWTPKYQSAVICRFQYNMTLYDGIVGPLPGTPIDGEIFVEVTNISSGKSGLWGVAVGPTRFSSNTDPRIGIEQDVELLMGIKQGTFSLSPPGEYLFNIYFEISCFVSGSVFVFDTDLRIDNVTLTVEDNYEPIIIPNSTIFGPFNIDPVDEIDVDFLSGGLENTSLEEARYRLNNSGTPGNWHTIFQDLDSYTDNWSISPIWHDLNEGENTIDLYCLDESGNYNDSVQITVIKDTVAPNTNTLPLLPYQINQEFDIHYQANDPIPSGGYNNTVKLKYRYNGKGSYLEYKPPWNPLGLFNQSPIKFNITNAGNYGEGIYEFYTLGIDNASNEESSPSTSDVTTIIDYIKPTSNAWGLSQISPQKTFNIKYNSNDSISGIDHIELWYEVNDKNNWNKWTVKNNSNFTKSPITFTAVEDGIYGFKTVAYDKAGNIEEGGIPKFATIPDVITEVDSQAPEPRFVVPQTETKISGKQDIIVSSNYKTEYVAVYYWIDFDEDGYCDDVDDNSSWVLIENISRDPQNINFTTAWDTKLSSELAYTEHMVVLKAVAVDKTNNKGENITWIEVDNQVPSITITNPRDKTAENGLFMYINYTTDSDVKIINIYYRLETEISWTIIKKDISFNYGNTTGSYKWDIPTSLRAQKPRIEIKVEAVDDVNNVGDDTVSVGINWGILCPPPNFPRMVKLNEDFGKWSLKLTPYEFHTDPQYSNDNLKWYVTGNSRKIFLITGDNSTGINADTFTFFSIQNKHGTETLTFHLHDPQGLEATFGYRVIVNPVNDPPEFFPPFDSVQISVGEIDIFDLSIYIQDIDNNITDLSVSVDDPEQISIDGLKLIFDYPPEVIGQSHTIKVIVTDLENSTTGMLNIRLTDNHRPILIKPLPDDITLQGGVTKFNVFDLDDYFRDPDLHDLIFNSKSKNVEITINNNNYVSLKAKENFEGIEKLIFIAMDPLNAFTEGAMDITIFDINNPPRIKNIPDIYIHYTTDTYNGYGYDFTYFISDPDNDRSELTIMAWPIDLENKFFENDPENNMRLIFQLPFEAADGKKHPVFLHVNDPDPKTPTVKRIFNISIIKDSWPVEQMKRLPDQYFRSDQKIDNAFYLLDYFYDRDSRTDFEISIKSNNKIIPTIDNDFNLDLSCKFKYWEGTEEVTIIAHDTMPEQHVYAVLKVHVSLPPLPKTPQIEIDIIVSEERIMELSDYLKDFEVPISNLIIRTNDPAHVQIDGSKLVIKFDEIGSHTIRLWIEHKEGYFNTSGEIIVNVEPAPKSEVNYSSNFIMAGIGVIIVIILIIVLFIILRKKKLDRLNREKLKKNHSLNPNLRDP